ncbi:MAG: preprotein translocase subunit YajC [Mariprofundaceae bacterium]|nr:preprotein translocase subunit YajC [Mariprofundaceae bacterium]
MKNIMRSIFISMAAVIASTSPALAADAAGSSSGFTQLIPLVVIMVIFYFLLIRPQQKRAKEHRNMVESLKKGDKVLTNGGIHGTIMDVKEGFLKVEIAEGVRVKMQRDAVAALSD